MSEDADARCAGALTGALAGVARAGRGASAVARGRAGRRRRLAGAPTRDRRRATPAGAARRIPARRRWSARHRAHDRAPVGTAGPVRLLGFSIEFQAVRDYTGHDPAAINPVLVQLIRNLSPGPGAGDADRRRQHRRLVGPDAGVAAAAYRRLRAHARAGWRPPARWRARSGRRMILGLNLAANEPTLAAAEARAYVQRVRPPRDRRARDRQRAQRVRQDHRLPHAVGTPGPGPARRATTTRSIESEFGAIARSHRRRCRWPGRRSRPARRRCTGSWIEHDAGFLSSRSSGCGS